MHQRLNQYSKAVQNLKEALNQEIKTARDEAGIIKLFELTYELSWKVLKAQLEEKEGIITKSPREAINESYRQGWIQNEDGWFDILKARNTSAHVYDEEGMESLIKKLPAFLKDFEGLNEKIKS